jgi:pyrimidine operon attenuation protein / uracil phosphoribosyltransferase
LTTYLDKQQLYSTIQSLATQLIEKHGDFKDTVVIGLQTGGVFVADKIVEQLRQKIDTGIKYGKLDITFYRDDIHKELHVANNTEIPFSLEDKNVVLVDDVIYTGRTIRAALNALSDFGRASKVELCVLIDRKFSRELPIQPDYCGKAIESVISQKVKVEWDREEVILY